MEAVIAILGAFALIVLMCVVMTAGMFVGIIAVMSVWALVKPHISRLCDAWSDWFERRTGW